MVNTLVINEEADTAFSGHGDGTIRKWKGTRAHFEHQLLLRGHTAAVSALAMAGRILISGSYDSMLVAWNTENGTPLVALEGHGDCVTCLAMVGKTPVSGSYDGHIRIWNLSPAAEMPESRSRWEDAEAPILCLARLSESRVAAGTRAGTLLLMPTCRSSHRSYQPTRACEGHPPTGIHSLVYHDTRSLLYAGAEDGCIRAFSVVSASCVRVFQTGLDKVFSLAFFHKDFIFAGDRAGSLRWCALDEPGATRMDHTCEGMSEDFQENGGHGCVFCAAVANDRALLLLGCGDGAILRRELEAPTPTSLLPAITIDAPTRTEVGRKMLIPFVVKPHDTAVSVRCAGKLLPQQAIVRAAAGVSAAYTPTEIGTLRVSISAEGVCKEAVVDVCSGPPSPARSSVQVAHDASCSERIPVCVTILDALGNVCDKQHTVHLHCQGEASEDVVSWVSKQAATASGVVNSTFSSTKPGRYKIWAVVAGIQLPAQTCSVVPGAACAPQCSVSGVGVPLPALRGVTCGAETTLIISVRDAFGNARFTGGDEVIVLFDSLDATALEITDCHDGTHMITFTPACCGRGLMRILVNGEPVPGSPFQIAFVEAGPVKPPNPAISPKKPRNRAHNFATASAVAKAKPGAKLSPPTARTNRKTPGGVGHSSTNRASAPVAQGSQSVSKSK